MVLRHLDLFSGIGGFSLGLEATGGFETVAFCDIEEFPRKVLQKHWPGVKQYEDIKELNYEKLKADGLLPIDIITGGYPCQPFSVAGRKKGEKDPRHLWPEYFRLIKELRPTWVIGENVSGHIKLGLDTVLENLESEGYSVRTFSISAASIGANHQRERIWIVANTNSSGNKGKKSRSIGKENEKEKRDRQVNSTTRFPDGTDSIVTKQKSETEVEYVVNSNNIRSLQHTEATEETSRRRTETTSLSAGNVENTRRSLRQRSEFRGENENEIRQGNANISERSSEASEFDVANTSTHRSFDESKRKTRDMEEKSSGKKETRNKSTIRSSTCSTEMANTENIGSVSSLHEKEREGNSSRCSKGEFKGNSNVANTKSSQRNGNEINREHSETETQEEPGVRSSISRTQGGSPWEGWWDLEPNLGRVVNGVPARAHRLKGLGNSLVPAIPFYIGTIILEVMKDDG
jgi:DNA-cytosine methyltransferase